MDVKGIYPAIRIVIEQTCCAPLVISAVIV
jgi:hypothetical protein